jgi:hypothetical protein
MARRFNLGKIGAALVAVLVVGMVPAGAHAEALVFRNETNGPIIVQAACVVRGVLRRGRPILLKPGDATPGIVMPGNKLITVYDGTNPNHVVFQGTVPGGPADQLFGVGLDPTTPGAAMLNLKTPPAGPGGP